MAFEYCRTCAHELTVLDARCPECGRATGLVPPLPRGLARSDVAYMIVLFATANFFGVNTITFFIIFFAGLLPVLLMPSESPA